MKIKRNILTIDPGASGGIAFFNGNTIQAVKMPKSTKDLDNYFKYIRETYGEPVVFIEKVQSYRGKEDDAPGKKFGINKMLANYSKLVTVIEMNGFQFVEVYPVSWQSTLELKFKKEKGMADNVFKTFRKNKYKEFATNCFPEIGKVTLATSDALCLVQFALVKYENEPSWILQRLQNKDSGDLL